MPKVTTDSVELVTDELVNIGTALACTIPATLTTITGRGPQHPGGTAATRAKAKIQAALNARAYEPMPV